VLNREKGSPDHPSAGLYFGMPGWHWRRSYCLRPRAGLDLWKSKQGKLNDILGKTKKKLVTQNNELKRAKKAVEVGDMSQEEFNKMKPAEMVTYGYIFDKNKKDVKTFASYDSKEECFSDRNVFPIGCIVRLEKINL
jgi:hypothetical protein